MLETNLFKCELHSDIFFTIELMIQFFKGFLGGGASFPVLVWVEDLIVSNFSNFPQFFG